MKIIYIITKGMKEQLRSFWVLLLTLSLGPFFVFIYFLLTESEKIQYTILVTNIDKGIIEDGQQINYGKNLVAFFNATKKNVSSIPAVIIEIPDKNESIVKLKNKKADALILIPESFSQSINSRRNDANSVTPELEFLGDLTNMNYLISSVWANGMANEFTNNSTYTKKTIEIKETALGSSANINSFNMLVPGILIISIIMLMYTASTALISEVENKTIMRLKLSKLSAFEFLAGNGAVQLIIGLVSVGLTLLTAILLGFHYQGSLAIMFLIAGLTTLSIVSFSLIIAAATKSTTEVLVVGSFPLFVFFFFTGAAIPLKSNTLFTIIGYPVSIQGLMSPTHAISALHKTLIMNMNISSIIPEIIAIIVLTILYFIIGAIIFNYRHLKLA
jgi:ABC-2 type transport system permease protein